MDTITNEIQISEKFENDHTPRPYQMKIFNEAIKKNSIIYLPTGSGKTFIAVLLIKNFSKDLRKKYSDGGKRAIFLVNTVPLVNQQCAYLSRHTGLKCNGYYGDNDCDKYSYNKWMQEISNYQILVMTSQIFLNILNQGIITMERCSIIFFDECHRAVEDHPMRLITIHLNNVPTEKQPRIIGLSATLLNSNVKLSEIENHLKVLESTLNATIVTIDKKCDVQRYSTSPVESVVLYNLQQNSSIMKIVDKIIYEMQEILNNMKMETACNMSSKEFQSKTIKSKLMNCLLDIKEHFNELGLYGGNEVLISHLLEMDGMKEQCKSYSSLIACNYLISKFLQLRAMIHSEMKEYTEDSKILKYSSNKILRLFQTLNNFMKEKQDIQEFCCIIFVQRRFTAKVIFKMLEILQKNVKGFEFLKPGFMIGDRSNLFKEVRPNNSMVVYNRMSLDKFRKGEYNCLVSTDVIDEGIDVPICTLVIRFSFPQDFRGYVQSKGRARDSKSQYKVLVDLKNKDALLERYLYYRNIENRIEEILYGQTDLRQVPASTLIDERYEVTDKASGITSYIDEHSAISLVNKYCSSLYKLNSKSLSPTWILHTSKDKTLYQVSLEFPSVSPLRGKIYGEPMSTIERAKRRAAYKGCIQLHQFGELNDRLNPKNKSDIADGLSKKLFPCWLNEELNEENPKRLHQLESAECLYNAYPTENSELYLHVIEMIPVSNKPMNGHKLAMYDLMNSRNGFAILTNKEMPPVPMFPVFMNGEWSAHIHINYEKIHLSSLQINKLLLFHTFIFSKVVPIMKKFMVFDKKCKENSYLIVPVDSQWRIDWNVANCQEFLYKDLKQFDKNDYSDMKFLLIETKYRFHDTFYLVTNVRQDLSVWSPHPNDDYKTYYDYYLRKHNLYIKNVEQPLLEVKLMVTNFDFHKPCYKTEKEDQVEILVPELCRQLDFPASYFIKASTLPTVIYRLTQLLIADKLRTTIAKEIGLELNKTGNWKPFTAKEVRNNIANSTSDITEGSMELEFEEENDINYSSFGDTETAKNLSIIENKMSTMELTSYEDTESQNTFHGFKVLDNKIIAPQLKFHKNSPYGPELTSIVKALTTAEANDIVNLERLETLGDSFLKFATCVYLFETFPNFEEGVLTNLKNKIVGDRNLYYCGKAKSIPGMIKIQNFECNIVPSFIVCRNLQNIILNKKINASILNEISVSTDERLEGTMSPENLLKYEEIVPNHNVQNCTTSMQNYLSLQLLNDKNVSDAVEALVGVYVEESGVDCALKVLQWLKILPQFSIQETFYSKAKENNTELKVFKETDFINTVSMATFTIEKKLGYKFTNRNHLIQAMTHPTYMMNGNVKCYERLEFVGDSVIDFLITKYIYEKCEDQTPGELTDIRSSLVNNVTFACLAVRHGLHTTLLSLSPTLQYNIDKFVKFQEKRNHLVDVQCLDILTEKNGFHIAEIIDAPKVLGDIFESTIGAVYVDSGKNLSIVWEVLYRLMEKEIEQFIINTPKQPIRDLLEMTQYQPRFSKSSIVEGTDKVTIVATICVDNKIVRFNGFGTNKKQARSAAAQHALDYIGRL